MTAVQSPKLLSHHGHLFHRVPAINGTSMQSFSGKTWAPRPALALTASLASAGQTELRSTVCQATESPISRRRMSSGISRDRMLACSLARPQVAKHPELFSKLEAPRNSHALFSLRPAAGVQPKAQHTNTLSWWRKGGAPRMCRGDLCKMSSAKVADTYGSHAAFSEHPTRQRTPEASC